MWRYTLDTFLRSRRHPTFFRPAHFPSIIRIEMSEPTTEVLSWLPSIRSRAALKPMLLGRHVLTA
jgi:hypothetical protein